MMSGNPPTAGRGEHLLGVDSDPILSFIETGDLEPHPRLLVDRLLYARMLLSGNAVLAPRFVLGECAAAHHIMLDDAAAGAAAVERLLAYGFRVELWDDPAGIRFFLLSSHAKSEIRALLVAITMVVRELAPDTTSSRCG